MQAPTAPPPPATLFETGSVPAATPAPASNEHIVKSPIVGTYYDAPKPGDPPFVKVGDAVEPGQVLCIIESMKLMNEIESEVAGTVVTKLMENGRPVEYGEALFAIRPR
jgi:acetyl-CoA carboxylase biotin carboxyl carrier protein